MFSRWNEQLSWESTDISEYNILCSENKLMKQPSWSKIMVITGLPPQKKEKNNLLKNITILKVQL